MPSWAPSHYHSWKRMFCKCLQKQWKAPVTLRVLHSSSLVVSERSRSCGISYRMCGAFGTRSRPMEAKPPRPLCLYHSYGKRASSCGIRSIQTEREYVPLADATLETIQDAVDSLFDRQSLIEYEVSLSSGVLTMKFPPHGTWVINKQTPNLQLWWSSPLSGPKRFEYDDAQQVWVSTKEDGETLGQCLSQELQALYPELDPLELSV